ncbi:hypothetical protein [Loktanella salsilacus]|uniref:hypothetical protein n=1 Tax=Loktanella salsilacus TaxID=195913 RepID=UPI0020B8CA04|nr:hypothetical protein [Loktanella salsilacus]UTH44937.1 hypothetical protein KBK07_02250 [Loktanella salsilacus]
MLQRIIIVFGLFLLAGCTFQGGRLNGASPESLIARGETQESVQQKLGKPGFMDSKGRAEAWQYCSGGLLNDTYRTIWFVDGRVANFSKMNASLAQGFCDQAFPAVNWGNRPENVTLD